MKKKKDYNVGGGFATFGLSFNVLKGVGRKGYRNPTPIQRKTIPLIMTGRDVVAMARTGSGKTAAFLLPLLDALKEHNTTGARGLLISPTRELAMQTFKFFKELGKFTGLRACLILGGSSMDGNFEALHSSPDVIIATPGRLLHVLVEMDIKLSSITHFILDEADRLFELGFAQQLKLISKQISQSRQTLLFSATLPQAVTEFSRIGLHDPVLIRLDKDQKLSELLSLHFFQLRPLEKVPLLLYLLTEHMREGEKTVVFLPTKHYVEYLQEILETSKISSTYIYSSLDQEARKLHIEKFTKGQCSILLVTDIAARGIDIPVLDNVINFNFPSSPKLFVHRVGRVARGGKSGTAISFVTNEELPYFIDVHLFLGNPIKLSDTSLKSEESKDGVLGAVNKKVISDYADRLSQLSQNEGSNLESLSEISQRSLVQYNKTCPTACTESVARAKKLDLSELQIHPFFKTGESDNSVQNFLNKLKDYKSKKTIFEVNPTRNMGAYEVMQKSRKRNAEAIFGHSEKKQKKSLDADDEIEKTEGYIPYSSKSQHFEQGLEISQFEKDIRTSTFDVIADDEKDIREQKSQKTWDRKKMKYTGIRDNTKKIKTESGVKISASFKTDRYSNWLKKNRVSAGEATESSKFVKHSIKNGKKSGLQSEVKPKEQVAKLRKKKARKMEFEKQRAFENRNKKKQHGKTKKSKQR